MFAFTEYIFVDIISWICIKPQLFFHTKKNCPRFSLSYPETLFQFQQQDVIKRVCESRARKRVNVNSLVG